MRSMAASMLGGDVAVDRVAGLGTVERDEGDAALDLVVDHGARMVGAARRGRRNLCRSAARRAPAPRCSALAPGAASEATGGSACVGRLGARAAGVDVGLGRGARRRASGSRPWRRRRAARTRGAALGRRGAPARPRRLGWSARSGSGAAAGSACGSGVVAARLGRERRRSASAGVAVGLRLGLDRRRSAAGGRRAAAVLGGAADSGGGSLARRRPRPASGSAAAACSARTRRRRVASASAPCASAGSSRPCRRRGSAGRAATAWRGRRRRLGLRWTAGEPGARPGGCPAAGASIPSSAAICGTAPATPFTIARSSSDTASGGAAGVTTEWTGEKASGLDHGGPAVARRVRR